jgi:hypothetical protein
MNDDIQISIANEEAASVLRENFEELVARVNGDLLGFTMNPNDPISIEAAVAFAEQRIDYHLTEFADNAAIQSLAPDIKQRFRQSINAQAREASR